jgi:hypothetical protein
MSESVAPLSIGQPCSCFGCLASSFKTRNPGCAQGIESRTSTQLAPSPAPFDPNANSLVVIVRETKNLCAKGRGIFFAQHRARHRMNAKSKIVTAFLMAAFLLITPAGKCLQAAAASPAEHPCHHKTPVPLPEDCGKPGCVYMKPVPVEVVITIGSDLQENSALLPTHKSTARALMAVAAALHDVFRPVRQEFLALHQLLI